MSHPTLAELEGHARASGLALVRASNWGWPLYRGLKWATNVNPRAAMRHFARGDYGLSQRLVSRPLYRMLFVGANDSPHGCQLITLWRRPVRA